MMSVTDAKRLMESTAVPLFETVPGADGTVPILIITPGWGSSGYYSAELLERVAPAIGAGTSVYLENTQMFIDHPTRTDEKERPERSIRDLAAVLTEAGHFEANGPAGPGIYSRMKVFPQFAEALAAFAPYIGLSHYVWGESKEGEAEGRKGPIITDITAVRSVDFVTLPGRGGAILESLREAAASAPESNAEQKTEETMTEKPLTLESLRTEHPEIVEALRSEIENSAAIKEAQEAQKKKLTEAENALKEAQAENARLKEAQTLVQAKALAEKTVAGEKIPDITKARIVEAMAAAPILKEDGTLDDEKFAAAVKEAVKREAKYLAEVLGTGRVRGMGGTGGGSGMTLEESEKALSEKINNFGGI